MQFRNPKSDPLECFFLAHWLIGNANGESICVATVTREIRAGNRAQEAIRQLHVEYVWLGARPSYGAGFDVRCAAELLAFY